jgi:hypothetical protein
MLFVLAVWALVAVATVGLVYPIIDRAVAAAMRGQADLPVSNSRLSTLVGSLLSRRSGPMALAVMFALLALPIVALTLGAVDTSTSFYQSEHAPASDIGQWSAAAGAVLLPAVIAGTIGGPMVRRHARIGAFITFQLALMVAIAALPLLPASLGQSMGVGVLCLDACGPVISTNHLDWNLWAEGFFYLAPFVEPVPILILVIGVGIWTPIVRRIGTGDQA